MHLPIILPRRALVSLLAGVLLVALNGCAPDTKEATEPPTGLSTSRHELVGVVVSADLEAKEAIIDHEEIPDVMGAMRMGFTVPEAADRTKLTPGAKIKATLVMENATMWIEGVEVTGQGEAPPAGGNHAH